MNFRSGLNLSGNVHFGGDVGKEILVSKGKELLLCRHIAVLIYNWIWRVSLKQRNPNAIFICLATKWDPLKNIYFQKFEGPLCDNECS